VSDPREKIIALFDFGRPFSRRLNIIFGRMFPDYAIQAYFALSCALQ